MKETMFDKIYTGIYKKRTLENIVLNLESLKVKLEGTKKIPKERVQELIDHDVTVPELKTLFQEALDQDNLDVFSQKQITTLLNDIQNITDQARIVEMHIAVPLTEPDLKEAAAILEKKINKKVIINVKVDPSLVGGVIIKENKYIFDASLRTHLKNYENEWIKTLHRNHKKLESAK